MGKDQDQDEGGGGRRRRTRAVDRSTPGCSCTQCHEAREKFRSAAAGTTREPGAAAYDNNMGRVQHGAVELGWRDGGSDRPKEGRHFGHMRPMEMADREHREAYGKPLVAAYRHAIGPTPTLRAGDTAGAMAFLLRVEAAIEAGGWTRSEWARLYRLKDKFKARAEGRDPRFNVVGTVPGGLDKAKRIEVSDAQIVQRMLDSIERSGSGGSKGD